MSNTKMAVPKGIYIYVVIALLRKREAKYESHSIYLQPSQIYIT